MSTCSQSRPQVVPRAGQTRISPSRRGPSRGARPPGHRMLRPPRPVRVRNPVWYALVTRAEHAGHEAVGDVHKAVPAWRRSTPGEHRWPVTISVIVAIVLQLLLPDQLTMHPLPHYLLPVLEGGVLLGLAIANPVRIERRGPFVRWVSIVLILLITTANAASAVLLIQHIIIGHAGHRRPRCSPPGPPSGAPTSSPLPSGTGSSTGAARCTAPTAPSSTWTSCSRR